MPGSPSQGARIDRYDYMTLRPYDYRILIEALLEWAIFIAILSTAETSLGLMRDTVRPSYVGFLKDSYSQYRKARWWTRIPIAACPLVLVRTTGMMMDS